MKGDEFIKIGKAIANQLLLLLLTWDGQDRVKEIIGGNIQKPMIASTLRGNQLHRFIPTICFVISHQKIRISID